ncbi:Uncharacterized protein DAT39_008198, partial [Clarias magur]
TQNVFLQLLCYTDELRNSAHECSVLHPCQKYVINATCTGITVLSEGRGIDSATVLNHRRQNGRSASERSLIVS